MIASRVSISISDPWDLGESLGWKPLTGELQKLAKDEKGGRALINLDAPLTYRNTTFHYLVATPRHVGDNLDSFFAGRRLLCAFTGVSDARAESESPLDCSDWRGGLAAIGDLELKKAP